MDDEDEPQLRRGSRIVVAAVGFVIALGAGGAWLSMSSAPAPATNRTSGYTPPPATPVVPPPLPSPQAAARAGRAPRPRVEPPRPVPPAVTRQRPTPPRAIPLAEPARLSINSVPWGNVYIDGEPVGNTPQLDLPVAPGTHRLRVEREGFRPHEREIDVAPGQRLRITDIVLRDLVP